MSSTIIRIVEATPETSGLTAILPARATQTSWNTPGTLLERIVQVVVGTCHFLSGSVRTQRKPKTMRLCETISLGEKRFLAIVQVDEERILIGGSASTVTLLTRIPDKETFSTVLLQRSQPMHS